MFSQVQAYSTYNAIEIETQLAMNLQFAIFRHSAAKGLVGM